MTCIVGLVYNGTVYIGGDSAGVAGYELSVRADKKVFKVGDFIIGFTSSFRMGQLLQYDFSPPKRHPDTEVYKFMVTDFINEVRSCFKRGGYAEKNNDVERGGFFLVGYSGRLFSIQGDYQVGERVCGYDAVGCGEAYALGSLYTTQRIKKPKQRINIALRASEELSAGVRSPFIIEEL